MHYVAAPHVFTLVLLKRSQWRCACRSNRASPLSDDNLMAHNHLQSASKAQAAQDMVFIAPADASHVDAVLEDNSHVDVNLPFDLAKMPQMPRT